jgi:hypothetical protein
MAGRPQESGRQVSSIKRLSTTLSPKRALQESSEPAGKKPRLAADAADTLESRKQDSTWARTIVERTVASNARGIPPAKPSPVPAGRGGEPRA